MLTQRNDDLSLTNLMEMSILTKNIVEIYENLRPKHRQWNRFLQRKTIPIAAYGITIALTCIADMKNLGITIFIGIKGGKVQVGHKSPFRGNLLQVWVQRKANL